MTSDGYKAPLFITGSTASGKSALALEVARRLEGEIINADAYQVYKGMPLLTALMPESEREGIAHHLFEILEPEESWDASLHYKRALPMIESVQKRGKLPIIVGGSGLYVKFLSHGMSESPPSSPELREELEAETLDQLVFRLESLDREGAASLNLANKRYVVRALEILILGGKPLAFWQQNWQKEPAGNGYVLDWPVEEIDARIYERTALMFKEGVVQEAKALLSRALSATAQKTLGLSLLEQHLAGELSLSQVQELLGLRTRQYAKRQRTWLKREPWLISLQATGSKSTICLAEELICDLMKRT